jgi:hypothetical protein
MFNAVSPVPVDCNLVLAARGLGATLLGLAVVTLEAWLRFPVQPLFHGYLQMAQSRAAAVLRRLSF